MASDASGARDASASARERESERQNSEAAACAKRVAAPVFTGIWSLSTVNLSRFFSGQNRPPALASGSRTFFSIAHYTIFFCCWVKRFLVLEWPLIAAHTGRGARPACPLYDITSRKAPPRSHSSRDSCGETRELPMDRGACRAKISAASLGWR